MRAVGVVAVTVVILTLALVSAGCGGTTAEAARWVTVVEDGQDSPFGFLVLVAGVMTVAIEGNLRA